MRMPGLARLHASMQPVGLERVRFRIPHNHLVFEGVFLTDSAPWQLGLACVAHNFVLLFNVLNDYEVRPYIEDRAAFDALLNALRNGGDGPAFSARTFLEEIDGRLPAHVTARDRAMPADTIRFRPDVEEADKVHLCGWMAHPKDGGRRVTAANLAKTHDLISQAAHDWCERHNVSSRWTDDPRLALPTVDRPNWQGYV